jgi:uncharacterized membrane protein YbhN (UPF0104 family)
VFREPGGGVKQQAKTWVVGLLKYGIGFGLLTWVVMSNWAPKNGGPGIQGLLKRPLNVPALLGVALLFTGAVGLQIVRWYLLVRALDLPFTLRNALRLGLVGSFYNTFLPGAVGGDLIKAYAIAKNSPGNRTKAVATVVADRAIGLFGLILYVAAVGGGSWLAGDARIQGNDYLQFMVRTTAIIIGVAVFGWFVLGFLPERRAHRFAGRLGSIPKVGHSLRELWLTVWVYRQRPKAILVAVGLSAVAHTMFVFGFDMATRTFPPDNPEVAIATLPEHFVVVPIGLIAQALFPAPGGVGGGEAVFGWLYSDVIGKDKATGIVASLTIRVIMWILGLVGYIVYLRMKHDHEIPEETETGDGNQETGEPPPAEPRS